MSVFLFRREMLLQINNLDRVDQIVDNIFFGGVVLI